MKYLVRNAVSVAVAIIISYSVWGIVGLNGLAAALRQNVLYYWYQSFFLIFLAFFCWLYIVIRKENAYRVTSLFGMGIVAGYAAGILSICFCPLLAPDGWHRFLHMGWEEPGDLFLSGIIIGGWLNGLIMSGTLWLIEKGSVRQKTAVFIIVFIIACIRLIIHPVKLLRDFMPYY